MYHLSPSSHHLLPALVLRALGVIAALAVAAVLLGAFAVPAYAASDADIAAVTDVQNPADDTADTDAEPTATAVPSPDPTVAPSETPTADPAVISTPTATPTPPPIADDSSNPAPAPAPAPTDSTNIVDAITGIVLDSTHITDGDQVMLKATWSLPSNVAPGSHFGITLPAQLSSHPLPPFSLLDSQGDEVGICTVSNDGIDCVDGDYVGTHQHVHGDIWMKVTAHTSTEVTEVEILDATGASHTVPVTLAPKAPAHHSSRHAYVPSTHVVKRALSTDTDRRRIHWQVSTPAGSGDVTVNDVWTATGVDSSDITLQGTPQVQCKAADSGAVSQVPRGQVSRTGNSGMHVHINGTCDGTYIVKYWTQLPASATGSVTVKNTATVPGVGTATAHRDWNAPAPLTKSVAGDNDHRSATWTVKVDASSVPSGAVVIKDSYSDRLTLDADSVALQCKVMGNSHSIDDSTWSAAASDAQRHLLQVTINDTSCRVDGGQYVLTYSTAYPRDAFTGEKYSNSVHVDSHTATRTVTYTASAGGGAAGTPMWSLHLSKDVTGAGEALVGDTPFTVDWSWTDGGATKSGHVDVADGTGATIARIPAGAHVTLSEHESPVDGVYFTDPVYSGAHVQQVAQRAAQVAGTDGTVAVGLENPTALVPAPTAVNSPHQVPNQVPTPTPVATPPLVPALRTPSTPSTTTSVPSTPSVTTDVTAHPSDGNRVPPAQVLAHTGADPLPGVLLALGLLIAGGGLVVAGSRRRVTVGE
ncbi:DUF5979 domain-containing protein [Demequina sediminicola]|uniref:DUF5979 domain-containing protein n=1 Tax=Demequina sediminicola TaxID=1095026 RepID=UPI000782B791|nr:DUF5979 domain-containing protein [Demequina sediminicola]